MTVRLFLLFFFSCVVCEEAMSQWTQSDSVRLQEILSGERELKLNPEIQRLIESGTFLNVDNSFQHFISPDVQFPLPYINDYGALKSFHISSEEREYLKSLLPGAATFNAESILRHLFWKSHRAKVRNKKKATVWKSYNSAV
jgi:hypothetical protein